MSNHQIVWIMRNFDQNPFPPTFPYQHQIWKYWTSFPQPSFYGNLLLLKTAPDMLIEKWISSGLLKHLMRDRCTGNTHRVLRPENPELLCARVKVKTEYWQNGIHSCDPGFCKLTYFYPPVFENMRKCITSRIAYAESASIIWIF